MGLLCDVSKPEKTLFYKTRRIVFEKDVVVPFDGVLDGIFTKLPVLVI
jgi:hypothetical protein